MECYKGGCDGGGRGVDMISKYERRLSGYYGTACWDVTQLGCLDFPMVKISTRDH